MILIRIVITVCVGPRFVSMYIQLLTCLPKCVHRRETSLYLYLLQHFTATNVVKCDDGDRSIGNH